MSSPAPAANAARPLVYLRADGSVTSAGGEAVTIARSCGIDVLSWAELALDVVMAERADGLWAAEEAAVEVPRQNGKTLDVLVPRILWALFVSPNERRPIYTAHEFKTALETFEAVEGAIASNAELTRQVAPRGVKRSHGEESITLRNGRRFRVIARTAGSGRGFAGAPIILDEAYALAPELIAAIMPVISAQPNPQVIYASSTGDETAAVLRELRVAAEAGESDGLGYVAYGAGLTAEEVDPDDRAGWARANPGHPRLISERTIARERRRMTTAKFLQERLGVWPDAGTRSPIGARAWGRNSDAEATADPDRPVDVAYEVAADASSSSIVAAGTSIDERRLVRTLDHDDGDAWLVERLVTLLDAGHRVAYAGNAYGRHVADDLKNRGYRVYHPKTQPYGKLVEISPGDVVTACLAFAADVNTGGRVVHPADETLTESVRGSRARKTGEGWAWDRHNSTTPVGPLMAATLAAWSIERRPKPRPPFRIL